MVFLWLLCLWQVKYQFRDYLIPKDNTFVEQVKQRIHGITTGDDYNFGVRLALWRGGWKIFKDYPWTGCGFRCVDIASSQYPDPIGFLKRHRGMHNNFMQIAVDTGILGLTFWLGIWVCFFRLLYKRASALKGEPDSQWVVWIVRQLGLLF